MPSKDDVDRYCMHLFKGELWPAAKLLNEFPAGASKFGEAAVQRYLDYEYEKPIRRYVDVSPSATL